MYITISPQKTGGHFTSSSSDFVDYLEKENQELEVEDMEHFFNQYGENISAEEVISSIDKNTTKLKSKEPKFYSITVNPSQYELQAIQNSSAVLKDYTKSIMQDYVSCFNREIKGRPIGIKDIVYFAKIEHQRTFKGTDKQVRENQPYASQILELKTQIRKIEQGTGNKNIQDLKGKIDKLEQEAPWKQDGKRIVQGMQKNGYQSHIHIIVSRKDASNSVSLSPGSKYKASEVMINGRMIKRGFNRDAFFEKSEKRFDKMFNYKRNYAESYQSKKDFVKNPKLYFSSLLGLPISERALALKILGKSGVPIPNIPFNTTQVAIQIMKKLQHGIGVALKSGSIGI
ncbi:MobB family relaxase [Formosa haliotis]|uniref:MobB family relaxase n=1 Tax=Formosa haliotis TaxID=1555194 RepID=UPI000825B1C2|nr:MobB family relaxase [Formosa haliotis]